MKARHGPFSRAVLLAALASIVLTTGTAATRGVAVDLGRIDIEEALAPGGSYSLPTMGVRNPGDEESGYVMRVTPIGEQGALAPAEDWFTFEPGEFRLAPGAQQPVRIRLRVPADAEPAAYQTLLQAMLAPEGEGALVGAAAGTRLTFSVQPSSGFDAAARWLGGIFMDLAPWSVVVPAAIVLIAAVLWLRARFSLRFVRRA